MPRSSYSALHGVNLRKKSDKLKGLFGGKPSIYNGASSAKIVNNWKLLTIFAQNIPTADVWLGFKYTSENYGTFEQISKFTVVLSVALSS